MRLFAGIIIGITLATIGFTGIARLLDNGVERVKAVATEASQ